MLDKTKSPKDLGNIISRISTAEQWRDGNYREDWRRYYRLYRSKVASMEGRSNVFVPYTFMQIEVIKSRLSESLFSARPYLTVLPRGDEDKSRGEKVQTLLDWQMNERMDLQRMCNDKLLQSLCCYGTAVTYTGWLVETRKVKSNQTIAAPLEDQFGQPLLDQFGTPLTMASRQVMEREIAVYDDPVCQSVDIFDFFVDPDAEDIADSRYCGHREYLTQAQLDNLVENAGYRIDFSKLDQMDSQESGHRVRREENGVSGQEEDFAAGDKNRKYKVHHYWEDNRHLVIVNESHCALDEENPFWHGMKPYDKCCYTPLPHEFYGIGIPECIESLQMELNTTRNQRIDYNSLALRRMWKVRKGCGITPQDLIWRQNGILQVENMDDVQEIQVAPLPASAFANENNIKQDMRDSTGCHDIIMGLAQSDETATTTMTKDNNASIRFKNVVTSLIKNIIVPVGKKCMSLNQQFLTDSRVVRLLNEDPGELFSISPYELDGEYDLIYVGSAIEPMANKELIKQHALEAYQLAAGNPLYQMDQQAMLKLIEQVYKSLEMDNIQELLPTLPTAGMNPLQEDPPLPEQAPPDQDALLQQLDGGVG
ncbi:MAG: hypothetical protein RR051_00350 [Clostridiales bacterium]